MSKIQTCKNSPPNIKLCGITASRPYANRNTGIILHERKATDQDPLCGSIMD